MCAHLLVGVRLAAVPNVLLFGGSQALFEMLNADSRWKVLRVVHSDDDESSRDILGDPRQWHLVIDDCPHSEPSATENSEQPVRVSEDYLNEMTRAHGVTIGAGVYVPTFSGRGQTLEDHLEVISYTSRGAYDLEFNQTKSAEASHLVDFVDKFEGAFMREHLTLKLSMHSPEVLFQDYYRDPLVAIRRYFIPWLHTIDIADDNTRLEAYEYLCRRTVPKLWPEVYSDQFRPAKVRVLEGKRERIIAERRQQVDEIDAAIDEELRFFAVYAPLTELSGDPLKLLVKKAFEEVFGCGVIDLDEEVEEGESKTLDLLVQRPGWTAFVEVRSSLNRGASKDDIERMEEHHGAVAAKHGEPNAKVFVFNGMFRREPEKRTEKDLFSRDVIAEAQSSGVTLFSTIRLLQAIEARRNSEINDEQFIRALSRPGLFAPPAKTS